MFKDILELLDGHWQAYARTAFCQEISVYYNEYILYLESSKKELAKENKRLKKENKRLEEESEYTKDEEITWLEEQLDHFSKENRALKCRLDKLSTLKRSKST